MFVIQLTNMIKKTLLSLTIFCLFVFPFLVSADQLVPCKSGECTLCDLFVLINNIIKFLMVDLVPPIAVFTLLLGGMM